MQAGSVALIRGDRSERPLSMRFDRNSHASAAQLRREKSRLLRLVGLMALVLVLIEFARKPASWDWITQLDGSAATREEESAGGIKPIAVKRGPTDQPLPADEVYARVAEEPLEPPSAVAAAPAPAEAAAGEPVHPPAPAHSLGLPPDALEGIADDWFGMTRAEQPALGRLARHLASLDAVQINQLADREATFEGLMGNPDYYRGRVVSLRGRLRRCTRGRIGAGDLASDVWEAWIVAPDSRNTPYLVYVLELPAGMPTGESLDELVQFSGVFVRRFAYASVGGEAISPLLMARTIEQAPAPLAPVRITQEMQWSTLIFVGGIGAVLLGAGGWYLLSDRRFRRSRLHAIGESRLDAATSDLQALSQLDGGDPHRIRIEEP